MEKFNKIRKDLQETQDVYEGGYQLKDDIDIINMIRDFGDGETEFHTADIERLIKEKHYLQKRLKDFLDPNPKLTKKDLLEFRNKLEKFSNELEENGDLITEAIDDVIMISTMNDKDNAFELIKTQFFIVNTQDIDEFLES